MVNFGLHSSSEQDMYKWLQKSFLILFLQEKNIGKFSDVHILKICFLQKIKQSLPL